jgi:tetratricopeptide (TPR) repeat protein
MVVISQEASQPSSLKKVDTVNQNQDESQIFLQQGWNYFLLAKKHESVADMKAKEEFRHNCGIAFSYFTQAIILNPDNSLAYWNRARVRTALEDYQGAIADYSHAIKGESNSSSCYMFRAITYLKQAIEPALLDLQQSAILYEQQGKNKHYQEIQNLLEFLDVVAEKILKLQSLETVL